MEQRPIAVKGTNCPFHKQDVSKVCHRCELFVKVVGAHPQTGEHMDKWKCAIAWMPLLTIENSNMQRQTGAAIESFRNEVVKASERVGAPGSMKLVT
jgi:hypothetical protein